MSNEMKPLGKFDDLINSLINTTIEMVFQVIRYNS